MKKLGIYIILTFFISVNSFAQSLSLNELMSMSRMNVDAFDTYATKNGYGFNELEDFSSFKRQTYATEYNKNSGAIYWLSLFYDFKLDNKENKKSTLQYQTLKSTDYLRIKEELPKAGFVFFNQTNLKEEGNRFVYKNGKTNIYMISKVGTNSDKTLYIVEIINYN